MLATLSASVLERRRDFALMKALGGAERQMMGMFLAETLVLAGAGVVVGYVAGSALAWGISEVNFGTGGVASFGGVAGGAWVECVDCLFGGGGAGAGVAGVGTG